MRKETIDRLRKFIADREWEQYHTPANLAKSISIVKEELADVMVYCRNLLDELGLDEDEIINAKMTQNEAKYPVEKARGNAAKYDQLADENRTKR